MLLERGGVLLMIYLVYRINKPQPWRVCPDQKQGYLANEKDTFEVFVGRMYWQGGCLFILHTKQQLRVQVSGLRSRHYSRVERDITC